MKVYNNYHFINTNNKMMHDGLLLLQNSLDGFEGYDVLLNNTKQTKVLFYDKYDSNSNVKKIIGYVQDIDLGNLFKINNENWLVVTYPEDNKIYRKAEVQLCNSTYPIKANATKVLKLDTNGNPILNQFGDPVYTYTEGATTYIPCIVEYSIIAADENKQFPLPEGQLRITMQYQNVDDIQINKTFTMYNNTYKIRTIDYTKVINDKGIMTLSVEQVTSEVK